ncbi:response regulator, partial [Wolinella succinogenes]
MSHKPTILVIDDTESNLDMLMAILKNYDVIPALSGKEALEIVKNEKIDLILLDIMMPEMDGY